MAAFASFRSLQGKTIKYAIIMNQAGCKPLPVLVFEDGSHVEFWQDAEGNGAGHAEIIPALHKTLLKRVAG